MSDAYLFNASWIFFAGWTAILVAITAIAFGADLSKRATSQGKNQGPSGKPQL